MSARVGVWLTALAVGAAAVLLLACTCHVLLPPAAPDDWFGDVGRLLWVLATGAAGSLVAATVAAVWPRPRVWRWLGVTAAAVVLCGPAVVWGLDRAAGARRHDLVAATIVGTWASGVSEVTYRPDGTCVSRSTTGPEGERAPWPGTYVISGDGLYISEQYPRPNDSPPPGGRPPDPWRIEFADEDHFVKWETSIKRLRASFVRVK